MHAHCYTSVQLAGVHELLQLAIASACTQFNLYKRELEDEWSLHNNQGTNISGHDIL